MKKYKLGEFEEVVMLTVMLLHDDAYGVAIKKEIEDRLDRSVSVGALQSALKRLVSKGYLETYVGETTKVRAGRPKRFYTITRFGKAAIQYVRDTRNNLWTAIGKLSIDTKS